MLDRDFRNMDVYENAGASFRLLKTVVTKTICDASKVLSASDTDRFIKAMEKINAMCSKAEDKMFSDYPELSNEYLNVFYGALDTTPRNDVDSRITKKARRMCSEIFERKQY